jgi:hypothetical protein
MPQLGPALCRAMTYSKNTSWTLPEGPPTKTSSILIQAWNSSSTIGGGNIDLLWGGGS